MEDRGLHSIVDKSGFYSVCDGWESLFRPSWFLPRYWGDAAKSVTSGGRGGAWIIESTHASMVLRYYSRGGMVAHLSQQSYIYTFMDRTRPVAELKLTRELFQAGLPVPEPIAAAVWRKGPVYKAALLIRRLSETVAMGTAINTMPLTRWRDIGSTVRRFHDYGVDHADLNGFNILLSDTAVFLIDFDRGKIRNPLTGSQQWRERNLARLKRSLMKLSDPEGLTLSEGWEALMEGYGAGQ